MLTERAAILLALALLLPTEPLPVLQSLLLIRTLAPRELTVAQCCTTALDFPSQGWFNFTMDTEEKLYFGLMMGGVAFLAIAERLTRPVLLLGLPAAMLLVLAA